MNSSLKDFGKNLVDHGLPITVLCNYEKGPKQSHWPDFTKHQMVSALRETMTGVGVITGRSLFDNSGEKICAIDLDIYDPQLRQKACDYLQRFFEEIKKPAYFESTPSGGIHCFFKYSSGIQISNAKYSIYNGSCKVKDNIVKEHAIELFFAKKQVVIAPSKARDKFTGDEKAYIQLSEIDLLNTCLLTSDEITALKELCALFRAEHNVSAIESRQSTSIHIGSGKNNGPIYDVEVYDRRRKELEKYGRSVTHLDKLIKSHLSLKKMLQRFGINGVLKAEGEANIFSLAANDGNNPGCVIYDNAVKKGETWDNYFVYDTHISYKGPLSRYLLCHADDRIWADVLAFVAENPITPRICLNHENTAKKTFSVESDYIPSEVANEILDLISQTIANHPGKTPTILICAPTGIGKTTLFCNYALQRKLKLLIALAYRSQVEQAKQQYKGSQALYGLCGKDAFNHPNDASFFLTYDKAKFFNGQAQSAFNAKDHILVIDEAHNLVSQKEFRKDAVAGLKLLSRQVKCVVKITATPEYEDFNAIDLFINIGRPNKARKIYFRHNYYHQSGIQTAVAQLIDNHDKNKIDVLLLNDRDKLNKLREGLSSKYPGLEIHVLHSRVRGLGKNNPYHSDKLLLKNIESHSMLKSQKDGIFLNGGILLTSSIIVDGVNINDENIGNIYILNAKTSTDYIQFPARFRKGYDSVKCFCSNINRFNDDRTREEYVDSHIKAAQSQKIAYDAIVNPQGAPIELTQKANVYLEHGKISDALILAHIAESEINRLNGDQDYFKAFLEKGDYHYNICVNMVNDCRADTGNAKLIIDEGKRLHSSLMESQLKDAFRDRTNYADTINLLLAYLTLSNKFSDLRSYLLELAGGGRYDALYEPYILGLEDLFYKICTGIELKVTDINAFVRHESAKYRLEAMRKTYKNLLNQNSGNTFREDDHFKQFKLIKSFILEYKELLGRIRIEGEGGDLSSMDRIDPGYIRELQKVLVEKHHQTDYGKDYKQIGKLVKDIQIICEFTPHYRQNQIDFYEIGPFWTFDNCHGFKTNTNEYDYNIRKLTFRLE